MCNRILWSVQITDALFPPFTDLSSLMIDWNGGCSDAQPNPFRINIALPGQKDTLQIKMAKHAADMTILGFGKDRSQKRYNETEVRFGGIDIPPRGLLCKPTPCRQSNTTSRMSSELTEGFVSQTFHSEDAFGQVKLFQTGMQLEGKRCTAAGSFEIFACITFNSDTRNAYIDKSSSLSNTGSPKSKERKCDPAGSGVFDDMMINCTQ